MSYNMYDVTYNVTSESGGLVQEKISIIAESMELAAEYITEVKEAEPASIVLVEEDTTVVSGGSTPTVVVESFNNRTGVVVPETGDYTVAQITGAASQTDLTAAENSITANANAITVNSDNINTNSQDISANATAISNNTNNITTNANAVTALDASKLDKSAPTIDAEVKTLKLNETADDAPTVGAGTMKYNSTNKTIEYSDGANYLELSTGGGGESVGGLQFKPLTVGYAGDSISVQWAREDSLSGMFWYKNLFNPCLIDNIFSTGQGGSPSSALISEYSGTTAQIEVLEAEAVKPELMIVHTTQNDYFGAANNAEEEALNVTTYCDRALAAGVENIIVFGHPPKTGTDEPTVLTYLNRILSAYAESTDGVHFIDVLSLWREIPTGEDASGGGIDWRTRYSDDGTHPTSEAMFEAGKLLAPILDSIVQGKNFQPTTASKFNYTTAPYNNVIGLEGLMLGTNGKYNGVDNANVAGSSSSEYWELSDGNGITATPSLVTGDDGYVYQQLVLGGTATANQNIVLQFNDYYSSIPAATYIEESKLIIEDVSGVDAMSVGMDIIGQKAISDNGHIFTGKNELHITEKIDFAGSSSSSRIFKLQINVLSGESPTGTIKLGRCGVYRQAAS